MRFLIFPLTCSLLFVQAVCAAAQGNTGKQEVADVVFRDMDSRINSHSAIYVGNTEKTESLPEEPFFHKVIQMAGIQPHGIDKLGYVTNVLRIGFDNFGDFRKSHPEYYGAFTLSDGVTLNKRKQILEWAQRLKDLDPPIDYIVMPGQHASVLLSNYFKTKEDLSYYTGAPEEISRMRSDAFVEYCYAAAGVPIARSQIDTPINLATMYGAATLVAMAREGKLYPNTQKDWMAAAQTENPTLTVKERSTGNEVADIAHETTLDFELQDTKSGPGLLKLRKDSYESEYGMADFSLPIELLQNGNILTGNINPAKTFKLSAADGLSHGYYQAAVYDHAGNSSPSFNFKIPPLSAISINSANALYDNFKGISATAPSTLERSHTFDFSEPVAGVSAVTIDGPQGNLWSQTFDPPISSTSTSLTDLPVGNYSVRALNAVGGETSTPFKIHGLTVAVSSASSYTQYAFNDLVHPGTFHFNLHVSAESSAGLDKVQLLTSTGAFIGEKTAGNGVMDFDFITPEQLSVNKPSPLSEYYSYNPPPTQPNSTYILRAFDKGGNSTDFTASLDENSGGFILRTNFPDSTDYKTQAYDLVKDFSLMPGAVFANYSINSADEAAILPLHAMGLRAGGEFRDSGGCSLADPGGNIGSGQLILSTWASEDGSDKTSRTVQTVNLYEVLPDTSGIINLPDGAACYYSRPENPDYAVCTSLTSTEKVLMTLKRYVQAEIVVAKANICHDRSYIDQNGNTIARYHVPGIQSEYTVVVRGFSLSNALSWTTGTGNNVATGDHIKIPLNSYGEVEFENVTSGGTLGTSIKTSRPPNGFVESPANITYEVTQSTDLDFSGTTQLTLKYNQTNLTTAQEGALRIFRIINPATGKYEDLGGTVNTVDKTISTVVTSFGKFMVAAYEFGNPQTVQSPSAVNGFPEMEFMSGAAVSLPQYDMGGIAGTGTLAALKSANKLPVGNVYSLSTATSAFEPSGAITMRYSGGAAAGLGVDENSLVIYGFTGSGGLYKLPYQTLDMDNKVLTARVPSTAYPLFAVLASSRQVENIPPSVYPDGISPETNISFNGIAVPVADGTYISSVTTIMFSASDPQVPDVITSGVNLTNYILNPDAGTVAISTYTGPFTLPEGANHLYYMSVDNAGNYEFPRATTIYVDATPPETELYGSDMELAPGSSFYAVISGTVTLTANDPLVSGARIGVYGTFYLVDKNFAECHNLAQFFANPVGQQPNFNGQPGTCENPLYTEAFTLSTGTHTVQYLSFDNVGNMESPKTFYLEVAGGDTVPPETYLLVNGSTIPAGGTADITPETQITLSATDPESNGVASGIEEIYYLVDVTPEACDEEAEEGDDEETPDVPPGTCQNSEYTGPFTLAPGMHTVYYSAEDNAGNEAEWKSAFFTVSSIQAALPVHPSSGPIGVPFTIEGAGFGSYSAGATVVLIGGTTTPLTLWTDGKIQGTIPGTLAAGQHPVVVKRGAAVLAEVSPFIVTRPALYTLSPSSGAIGLPFTLTGESFGNYVANYTRVLLGGTTMPLTLWTDTKIQGTIPGILPVGDYELVVERALNGGVVRTSTATFSLINMQAYWLAPSSGPIGMPFTITGAGFGNYSAAYTHVLLGDTTAPLTLWTDTRIQGTVPGGLIPGQYPVIVQRRTLDGGLMQTAAMQFEVVNIDVASMTPVAGPIGMLFTIHGANFGNYVANYTKVLIGGTTTPLTLWTDSKIQGAIPGSLAAGTYPVIIERELNGGLMQSSALAFTVSTPTAYSLSPTSGPIGVPFTINGVNFGNYSAAYTGVLINGATVPLTLWTDIKIQGTIPGNLALGQYPVVVSRRTTDGGAVQTAALTFEVAGVNVSSITPIAGPIGMPFTIYGNNFGNYSANYTKVLIGGAAAPLTLWTDTKIQGTIPGSLIAGGYPVIVERSLSGGQVQSSSLTWTLTMPSMAAVSPSSGPIGLPFTITGTSFGNYAANYTKVLIGGATAPLTLWTDTQIKGTIPGALAAGAYELYVERAINGGVVRTSTFSFMVGTPYLAAVSPSTAAVIAPFTLTGYNFGNYVANYTKVLVNGATTTLTLWTDTKIQGKLPFLLTGQYPVQVQRYLNGGLAESSTAWINIVEPVISSMSPISGAAGTVFNLYGAGFGPYDASQTRVTIGGAACALSLWTDTRITGAVPSTLSYGTHTVVASRGQALSNALEFYIPGGYSPSMLKTGAVPSALEFRLGEVYVYPDPAKGSKVPVFHIEVGTADSVKIKVFTVAGQLVHERTLTGNPQATGQTYAYEYAWIGRIASGVYYYTIEAERSGKKIKTKGRFSVVR